MTEINYFEFTTLFDLVEKGNEPDVRAYISKYIFPLEQSGHMIKFKDEWKTLTTAEIREVIFARIPKDYANYHFKRRSDLKKIVYEIGKPELYDNKINLCHPFKYERNGNYKPSKDVKQGIQILEDYMKNILCSGRQDCYDFLLKWLANMARGNKNNSCLYLKGAQGTGKSTLFQFLSKYVIGQSLCLETGSDPIRTKFNEILGGKLLVSIEELENFSRSEWESISSTLKRMITSDRIVLQDKGTKSHEENNYNNYMLCSNNDAIKDDDGRRYFILDISTKMIGNASYYETLYDFVMNDQVGEAFFQILHKIDVTGFNPQVFPLTQSKLESIVSRLDPVSKFLKDEYILKKFSISCSCADLYNQYIYTYRGKQMSAIAFHRKLSELGFVKKRRGTKWHYKVSEEFLLTLADTKHWLTDFDEFDEPLEANALETVEA